MEYIILTMEKSQNGVLQGSFLGQVLFNLFMNNLELGVVSEVAKFSDDTQLFREVKTKANCEKPPKICPDSERTIVVHCQ